ncbi:MAG: lyase family protein [Acidimicrobiales bacterium]
MFGELLSTDELVAATDGAAWVRAMLDAEAALAAASAEVGVVPAEAAAEIAQKVPALTIDASVLGQRARSGGNPVIPLVSELRNNVSEAAAAWVHWGATSQDILDTAAVLVAVRAGRLVDGHLAGLADGCAVLAARHRDTVMLARTLLQPALPTTFGAKAAGWLLGALDARRLLADATERLPASLGGAAGTLAAFGADGPGVAAAFAARLGLTAPLLPWHTARQRVAALGAALAIVAGTAAKVTGDVALLMQAEVGEAAEPAPGGSSTLPHKRNPVAAALAGAAARQAVAHASVLLGSVVAEHERPLCAWHAEWAPLSALLSLAGGAAAHAAGVVSGLHVDPAAMRANLDRVGPQLLSERAALAAAPAAPARDFDPAGYLGAAATWADRALAAHRGEVALP